MSKKSIEVRLRQMQSIISECLDELGFEETVVGSTVSTKIEEPKTLPMHILDLRDRGFFKTPKVSEEVHDELKDSYPCELNRVVTALGRLANRKALRKSTKEIGDEKKVAYVW